MTTMSKLKKGTNPSGVGCGGRKVRKKFIDQNHWRDTTLKGIEAACGMIR